MSKSAQKKRKSDVHLECAPSLPPKKDRPWFDEELNGLSPDESQLAEQARRALGYGAAKQREIAASERARSGAKELPEKNRRKSIVGLGKGLLKKMRSSSALKDRNSRNSTMCVMSSSTSAMPAFKHPSLNLTLDPMPEDRISVRSEFSTTSGESCVLPLSFHRNKELVRLVGKESAEWSDQASLTSESVLFEEGGVNFGSVASLCTPSRNFKRGKSDRESARSMPPESELIRGLCNSAIRRTFSSVSDSVASSQRFTRDRSVRMREKLLLSASMAELPEEEVAPLAACNEDKDERAATLTPIHIREGSSRRSSIVWSTLRSKSRIFGSKKRTDENSTPLSASLLESTNGDEAKTTPSGKILRRSSISSSSVHKKVSSALRKGFGLRGSNGNLTSDLPSRTPAGIIKRSSTTSKDRCRKSATFTRRCSDVSTVLERQVRIDQKRKEAEEAQMYMEKVHICDQPLLEVLYKDGYDAVIVDVGATGLPISDVAKAILSDRSGSELHKICMFNPYKNGILTTPKGKPDIIYIACDKEDPADKRVRIGIATGMREAFESGRYKKVIAYPFCVPEDNELSEHTIQQFLLTSYKAFTWSAMAKSFDGTITLAGIFKDNCVQIQHHYQQLLSVEIRPKIDAYASLSSSTTELISSGHKKENIT